MRLAVSPPFPARPPDLSLLITVQLLKSQHLHCNDCSQSPPLLPLVPNTTNKGSIFLQPLLFLCALKRAAATHVPPGQLLRDITANHQYLWCRLTCLEAAQAVAVSAAD